jgi:oligoribonuclease NrnB/cAMP/cGMP phosphodiesterase (DHH superfamily)
MEAITPGESVWMVDFSLSAPLMIELSERANLVWIDHHKTAIDAVPGDIPGMRSSNFSGCELAWLYLREWRSMPKAVSLLGRYDVWDHSSPDVLPFQYGMRSYEETRPDRAFPLWESLFSGEKLVGVLSAGESILRYVRADNKKVAKLMAYNGMMFGRRAVIINRYPANSMMFDSAFDPAVHEIMIAHGYKGGRHHVSLFSPDGGVDVSALAKMVGGGGHKHAAGFMADELSIDPFPVQL